MEGTIGEVRIFAGNFAPRAWAFCEGQLLAISQNQALFSIIGTIYGGDGRTTFALPDLRGRTAIGPGTGPGLSTRREGQRLGTETNTMTINNLPQHNHSAAVASGAVTVQVETGSNGFAASRDTAAAGNYIGDSQNSGNAFYVDQGAGAGSHLAGTAGALVNTAVTVGNTGGQQPINNMQPSLGVYYVICLQGVFPSRS